jgi:NitT/TauT family transport system substrate-binding protein
MRTQKNYFWWIIIVAAVIIIGVVGIRLFTQEKPIPQMVKVKMGLIGTPDILDVPYFIALEKGFFREEGLDVEFVSLHGDAIAIQSLISGDIDVTASGHFAVIKAVNEGVPVKAFASIQRSHDYVLATSDDIKDINQLKGRVIGIYAPGDITEIVIIRLLQKYGIDKDEVSWLSIGGSTDRYRALVGGKVAAVPLHADLGYKIQKETGFHILVSIAEEQPLPMSVVSATEKFIQEKPEIITGITRALIKASRYATTNKQGFIEVALKHIEGIDREEISFVYDFLMKLNIYGINGGITKESIENGIKTLLTTGELKEGIPVTKVADFEFINSVVNELGKYEKG